MRFLYTRALQAKCLSLVLLYWPIDGFSQKWLALPGGKVILGVAKVCAEMLQTCLLSIFLVLHKVWEPLKFHAVCLFLGPQRFLPCLNQCKKKEVLVLAAEPHAEGQSMLTCMYMTCTRVLLRITSLHLVDDATVLGSGQGSPGIPCIFQCIVLECICMHWGCSRNYPWGGQQQPFLAGRGCLVGNTSQGLGVCSSVDICWVHWLILWVGGWGKNAAPPPQDNFWNSSYTCSTGKLYLDCMKMLALGMFREPGWTPRRVVHTSGKHTNVMMTVDWWPMLISGSAGFEAFRNICA